LAMSVQCRLHRTWLGDFLDAVMGPAPSER
jgi:hypothetical protein